MFALKILILSKSSLPNFAAGPFFPRALTIGLIVTIALIVMEERDSQELASA